MRQLAILAASAVLLTGACANNSVSASASSQPPSFDELTQKFSQAWERAEVPGLDLSFVANLKQLGSEAKLAAQRDAFADVLSKVNHVDVRSLGICEQIDLSIMRVESRFALRRATLGLRYLRQASDISQAKRLTDVALGTEWYGYFLDRWNGAELDPRDIYAFGEAQLAISVSRYDALQDRLGYAGDDAGLARHLASSSAYLADDKTALDLFATKQRRVWERLGKLFPDSYGVTPARVAKSDRGAAFAVPGYYDGTQQTFYYNVLDDAGYEARQADWLLLHEATPGHHFQATAASNGTRCKSALPVFVYSAYAEGWAAYAETLGNELGLYVTPEDELAAIEWDMVRSVRVVLDVGLNAYGWSDEKALAYWHEHVRGQRHIAQREIDRMKRWPGQVVTYKYGANVFLTSKKALTTGADAKMSVRQFHDAAISYGSMPLATFELLVGVL